jgi:hypothetical protein
MSTNNRLNLQPCFILGAARSGTKLLRDLLACSDEIATIPYDVGYVWLQGNEFFPNDELLPEMASDRIKQKIRKTLPTLVPKSTAPDARILLEKSVPNTLRAGFLMTIYPEARFIHLIRDGRAVVESSYRQWKAPTDREYLLEKLKYFPLSNYRYAAWYLFNMLKGKLSSGRGQHIWGPRYAGIEEDLEQNALEIVCARQWRHCVESSRIQTSTLSAGKLLEIRYEDLVSSPDSLQQACRFLEIGDEKGVMDAYHERVTANNLDKWKSRVGDIDLDAVMLEISPLLMKLGYI